MTTKTTTTNDTPTDVSDITRMNRSLGVKPTKASPSMAPNRRRRRRGAIAHTSRTTTTFKRKWRRSGSRTSCGARWAKMSGSTLWKHPSTRTRMSRDSGEGVGSIRMDDELDIEPQYMEDEDYAEWIRVGMWRKKHAAEHEERMRKQTQYNARKAREKAIREETKRLERPEENERMKRRRVREKLREVEARELYQLRWKALLAPSTVSSTDSSLSLADIPWPIYLPYTGKGHTSSSLRVDDLTIDAVSVFLLPASAEDDRDPDASRRERRERLRDAMLRFHPDKFEGRVMPRVRAGERDVVREAVGVVVRMLNTLMAQTQ